VILVIFGELTRQQQLIILHEQGRAQRSNVKQTCLKASTDTDAGSGLSYRQSGVSVARDFSIAVVVFSRYRLKIR
jgi:hypothetical protein